MYINTCLYLKMYLNFDQKYSKYNLIEKMIWLSISFFHFLSVKTLS